MFLHRKTLDSFSVTSRSPQHSLSRFPDGATPCWQALDASSCSPSLLVHLTPITVSHQASWFACTCPATPGQPGMKGTGTGTEPSARKMEGWGLEEAGVKEAEERGEMQGQNQRTERCRRRWWIRYWHGAGVTSVYGGSSCSTRGLEPWC